jgi:hypothetical protein
MKISLRLLACLSFTLIIGSCNNKKETAEKGSFLPVLSFIQGQVANIDTSLYLIMQLNIIDSSRTDTLHVPREQFRGLAKDFLELPDLSDKKYEKRYKESKAYDETMNRLIIIYEPNDRENEIIQREELVVTPDFSGGEGTIRNVIVDYLLSSKDSSVQKRLLWQADRSFQVTTIKQLPGKPETVLTTKVTWNEPENQ